MGQPTQAIVPSDDEQAKLEQWAHREDAVAQLRRTAPPTSAILEQIREAAMWSILNSETKGRS